MTIKFSYAGSPATQLSIADRSELTLAGDFAVGAVVVLNGAQIGAYQVFWRTGSSGESGAVIGMLAPYNDSTRPNMFYFQIGGTTIRAPIGPIEYGQAYVLVLQRSSGVITSKLCPIQQSAPVDGSAVLSSSTPYNSTSSYDGLAGLILGTHSLANRGCDQSMGRIFIAPRALTDFEIAQIAHGKEITQFVTPRVYLKMSGPTDYADTGALANTVIAQGALAQGAEPGFGYSSVPTAPTIDGKPAIIGSPTPGAASSYTAAPATGNPSPTITQQWTLDGVDIAGATGVSYTPAASDDGKQLGVRQTASNGVGTPASSTSDPVLVTSATVSITPSEMVAESFRQQINDVASVPVSVTFQGSGVTKLEYQLYEPNGTTVVKPWADSGLSPSSGSFAGNVLMPAAKNRLKYRIAYRIKNASGDVLAASPVMTNRFGVGNVYVGIGSSTMAAWFGSGSGTGMIVDHNSVSTGAQDYWELFGTAGQASQMAMYFAEQTGYPVAFLGLGLGGSNLSSWADKNSTSTYGLFIQAVALAGGKLAGVFSTCGSNDITGAGGAPSVAQHLGLLRTLAANIRETTGQPDLPILLSGINRRTNADDTRANNARAAECIFGDDPDCYHVQTLDFELSGDGTHLTGAGYAAQCNRVRYVWIEATVNGTSRRGPAIASFRFNGDEINVALSHRSGNDFTPLSGITGFVVTDNKGDGVQVAVGILSCARTNATNILITCDQLLVAPTVTYLAGQGPAVGTPVYDNGPVPLPMTAEAFMPASSGAIEQPLTLVPYYAEYQLSRAILSNSAPADTTAPVLTGQLAVSNITYNSAALTWPTASDNVGVAGYERSLDAGATWVAVGSQPTVGLTGLASSTSFQARVRAYDDAGNRSNSLSASFTTAAAPGGEDPEMSFTPSPSRTLTVSPTSRALTGGPWFNLVNPAKPRAPKDPQAVIDISIDWAPWLADIGNPPIALFEARLAGLTDGGAYATGALTTAVVGGGEGSEGRITFVITTDTTPPLKDERTVYLDLGDL